MKILFHITSRPVLEESGLKDMTIFSIPLPSKSLAIQLNISGCKTRDEVAGKNVTLIALVVDSKSNKTFSVFRSTSKVLTPCKSSFSRTPNQQQN